MKTLSWRWLMEKRFMNAVLFISLVSMGSACTDEAVNPHNPNTGAASKGGGNTVAYIITNTSNGLVYTINLSAPTGAKDPGHLLLQFQDCDDNYLAGSYIQSATINDVPWPIAYTTGSGTGCTIGNDGPFIKLDNLTERDLVIVVTLSSAAASGTIIVKSGTSCSAPTALASTYSCSTEICQTETAWAAGLRYINPGNWATYTPYNGTAQTVTLWAGKTYHAGTVNFSDVVDGMVTITISFTEGWGLDPSKAPEEVKIQGYASAPSGNPAPGLFTTYKGSDLTVTIPQFGFYGVHVDIAYSGEECDQ